MKYKIFVDGREGTTGLQIMNRLGNHSGVELLEIASELRKDEDERAHLMNMADVVILCLPDKAAIEAVSMITNPNTIVLDASTAHRTLQGWSYGFPELSADHRMAIANAKRIAVPGCHATCFVSIVYPLIQMGVLSADYPLTCTSVTGYSGGGKNLIAKYEQDEIINDALHSPNFYALGLTHKHIPEMTKVCGLESAPIFVPIISDFYKGMTVGVPLFTKHLIKKLSPKQIHEGLSDYYKNEQFITVLPFDLTQSTDGGYFAATDCNNTNRLDILVSGNTEQTIVLARIDNLGKGSSGAAVQCMNIALGLPEEMSIDQ